MRSNSRLLHGLLVVLLSLAVAATAQEQGNTPLPLDQVEEDLGILEKLTGLGLSRAQADTILLQLPALIQYGEQLTAARQAMLIETAEPVFAIEWSLIKQEPVNEDLRKRVQQSSERYQRTKESLDRQILEAMKPVVAALSDAQKRLVEPDQARREREARLRIRSGWRQEAMAQATTDLTGWVRQSTDQVYQQQRLDRVAAVVRLAYRDSSQQVQQAVARNLLSFYDLVHRMNGAQFATVRAELNEQIRQRLFPPGSEPVETTTAIMTGTEWRELWLKPRTQQLLTAILPHLPAQ